MNAATTVPGPEAASAPRFVCIECGKRFRTVVAAKRALRNGCPKCGGCDVDLDVDGRAP